MLNQQFLDAHKERQEVLATISDESLKLWELSLHLQTTPHETNSLVHREVIRKHERQRWSANDQKLLNEVFSTKSHGLRILKTLLYGSLFSPYKSLGTVHECHKQCHFVGHSSCAHHFTPVHVRGVITGILGINMTIFSNIQDFAIYVRCVLFSGSISPRYHNIAGTMLIFRMSIQDVKIKHQCSKLLH